LPCIAASPFHQGKINIPQPLNPQCSTDWSVLVGGACTGELVGPAQAEETGHEHSAASTTQASKQAAVRTHGQRWDGGSQPMTNHWT